MGFRTRESENTMDANERLVIIEEIKQLKARYFRFLDCKDWNGWRNGVLAHDAELLVPEETDHVFRGAETIIDFVNGFLRDAKTIHHGHMPEITIESPTKARGVWAMEDNIFFPDGQLLKDKYRKLQGYGHYHENYSLEDNGWRIKRLLLTRLYLMHIE